jgi:hypothetical protein
MSGDIVNLGRLLDLRRMDKSLAAVEKGILGEARLMRAKHYRRKI